MDCRHSGEFRAEGCPNGCRKFLTYPEEKILSGKPEAFLDKTFGALSLALVKNDRAVESSGFSLLEDQQFSRNKTPMTREEVRWIILGKLRLSESSVLWDIGAGTGSVSVEAALRCRAGKGHCRGKKSPRPLRFSGKTVPGWHRIIWKSWKEMH